MNTATLEFPATATKSKTTKKSARKQAAPARPSLLPTTARARLYLTVSMGCFMPVLSLSLSAAAGRLIGGSSATLAALGCFAFALTACVLCVSLTHLADAIADITRSPRWASWLLAVAFDLALIFGELCHALAKEAGIGTLVGAIMVAVCLLSMLLNCWAFLRHPAESRRKGASVPSH